MITTSQLKSIIHYWKDQKHALVYTMLCGTTLEQLLDENIDALEELLRYRQNQVSTLDKVGQ